MTVGEVSRLARGVTNTSRSTGCVGVAANAGAASEIRSATPIAVSITRAVRWLPFMLPTSGRNVSASFYMLVTVVTMRESGTRAGSSPVSRHPDAVRRIGTAMVCSEWTPESRHTTTA